VTYSTAGVYTYTAVNSSNCDSVLTLNLVLNNGVSLATKVMLEGAFDVSTGLMKDSLRQVSHCASAQIGFPGVCPPVNVIKIPPFFSTDSNVTPALINPDNMSLKVSVDTNKVLIVFVFID